jgi:hypothetical protein
MANLAFVVSIFFTLAFLAFLAVRLRISRAAKYDFDPDWYAAFSTEKYRLMLKLLVDHDHGFSQLRSGRIRKRIRAERRNLFRGYLRNLVRDFDRLFRAARLMSVHADRDCSNVAIELIRLRANFLLKLAGVHFSLTMHALDISAPTALESLVESLESAKCCLQPMPTRAN